MGASFGLGNLPSPLAGGLYFTLLFTLNEIGVMVHSNDANQFLYIGNGELPQSGLFITEGSPWVQVNFITRS